MVYNLSILIENGAFILISLISFGTAYMAYKKGKGIPGAGLLSIGFVLYGIYGLLAFTGPGFTGSFFRDYSKVGVLDSQTYLYFIIWALRAGMVLIIAGIYQMARGRQT